MTEGEFEQANLTEVLSKRRSNTARFFGFIGSFTILFIFSSVLKVIILRFIPPMATPLMIIRGCENLFSGNQVNYSYQWKPMEKISSSMQLAVISSEDQNFPNHFGIDINEIRKAYKRNSRKGKRIIRGASTISQQVAKNVFLFPNRSYVRKALELYYTVLIEVFWSKEKILETYLNVVEMGDGIYGAEAASQKYFKKPASKLIKSEAAAIAAILPNPRKYSVKNPSAYIWKRRSWISRQMNSLGKGYLEKL